MIYFDNCATTRTDDDIAALITKYQTETFFNPSARSSFSAEVSRSISVAREKVSRGFGAQNYAVYFTSGGTESNNTAILGSLKSKKGNIVATAAEHSSVYNVLLYLQSKGYEVRLAKVLPDGHIDTDDFLSRVDENTLLACFMHVNNETGAVNAIAEINAAVKEINPRTVTFSDGIQAVGKIPVNLADSVDLYTLSGHKLHAGKGIGALFVKNGVRINALLLGGGQEKGLRSGTEYVGGIMALGEACQRAVQNVDKNTENFLYYKQLIRQGLNCRYVELCKENCSPAIMTVAFEKLKGEVLLHMLEEWDIVVGTGSACSSKNKQSRLAAAIGLPAAFSEGVLRLSFSKYNTAEQARLLGEKLCRCVLSLQKTMGV